MAWLGRASVQKCLKLGPHTPKVFLYAADHYAQRTISRCSAYLQLDEGYSLQKLYQELVNRLEKLGTSYIVVKHSNGFDITPVYEKKRMESLVNRLG